MLFTFPWPEIPEHWLEFQSHKGYKESWLSSRKHPFYWIFFWLWWLPHLFFSPILRQKITRKTQNMRSKISITPRDSPWRPMKFVSFWDNNIDEINHIHLLWSGCFNVREEKNWLKDIWLLQYSILINVQIPQ